MTLSHQPAPGPLVMPVIVLPDDERLYLDPQERAYAQVKNKRERFVVGVLTVAADHASSASEAHAGPPRRERTALCFAQGAGERRRRKRLLLRFRSSRNHGGAACSRAQAQGEEGVALICNLLIGCLDFPGDCDWSDDWRSCARSRAVGSCRCAGARGMALDDVLFLMED